MFKNKIIQAVHNEILLIKDIFYTPLLKVRFHLWRKVSCYYLVIIKYYRMNVFLTMCGTLLFLAWMIATPIALDADEFLKPDCLTWLTDLDYDIFF